MYPTHMITLLYYSDHFSPILRVTLVNRFHCKYETFILTLTFVLHKFLHSPGQDPERFALKQPYFYIISMCTIDET